jgi:hypothetical protein
LRRELRDDVLVEELAVGHTQVEAAERAGVSPRTVARRLEDPKFRGRVRARRDERYAQSTDRVVALLPEAIVAFSRVLAETDDDAIRLRAAKNIVDAAGRLRALEVEGRLAEVETRLDQLREDPDVAGGQTPGTSGAGVRPGSSTR